MLAKPGFGYVFDELEVGMSETIMRTVMSQDVIGFAQLSGDNNPVHLSDHFAAKTPFRERIAHGLYTASLISALLGTKLPGPGAIYITQTLNFRAPVKIGDVIVAKVTVESLDTEKQRATLHCECFVDARTVLDGEAIVRVPARGE
ncbi:MAG: MaoC family dehydratase [Flavobacteriaceae bacterium]